MSTWSETDEPLLRWVHEQPSSFIPETWILRLELRRYTKPSEEVPGLSTEQVDQALIRLQEHGLIDGERGEAIGFSSWSRLRVTALGLQVLGEWPDLDKLASAASLKLLLNELADAAPDSEDQSALRRLIGVAGEVGEGVVVSTLNNAAGELGTGLGGD
jgi:DNA-binding PadR family transcriptional regulator